MPRTGLTAAWFRKSRRARMWRSFPTRSPRAADAGTSIAEIDGDCRDRGAGADRRSDGCVARRARGWRLPRTSRSSRSTISKAMRSPAPHRSRPRLSLSAAAGLGRPLPAARRSRASGAIAGWRPPSTMPPDEAFDKAAKLLDLAYPGGPAIEALATNGDPSAFPLPRPLLGRRTAFLLRRAEERRAARSRIRGTRAGGYCRKLPAGGRRLPRRPHRARACKDGRCAAHLSWPAASRPIRRFVRALAELANEPGLAASSRRPDGCAPTMRR